MRITFGHITIEGKDSAELGMALAYVGRLAGLAKEHGAPIGKLPGNAIASFPAAPPHGGKGDNVARYLAQTGGERFRRSREELAEGLTEEQAAAARLAALNGGGPVGTEEKGESADGAGADPELLAAMEG